MRIAGALEHIADTHTAALERDCAELPTRHGYSPRMVSPRRWFREVRSGHNRWVVAEGRLPRPGASGAEAARDQIGTESAQTRAPKTDIVEHEGGGWCPTLVGWGCAADARAAAGL